MQQALHLAAPHARPLRPPAHGDGETGSNKLGQFFTEWAVRLTTDCVGAYCKPKTPIKIYVDGQVETGDPNEIELGNVREIAIVIGTAPAKIPMEFPR